ncbi:prolipoprotein diacylglyceryl transferase [Candidatus Woesearchaeota archaeon]|nr:prolipoprotein diacylglyceryl transferase [Candidatus Woesearchaeota archaeon]
MFKLGPLHMNMYGIMFALGILAASFLAIREAKKRNISKDVIWDLVFYLLIGIIVGARLFYVLFYWPQEIPLTLIESIAIWKGGLAFFGGFLGALVAGYIFVKKRKLKFWQLADIFSIPLVIGHIFGRLGDYFTGGHPGNITSLPWGIYLNNAVRHPVVLYEIIGLIIIVIILLNLRKVKDNKQLFDGFVFSSYVILYSIQRLILDFFRIESTDPRFLGLTPSQYVVIILFNLAIIFILVNFKKVKLKSRKH